MRPNWKKGDYFGSTGLTLHEQQIPVVTIISPFGNKTRFSFQSAGSYQNFIVWATTGLLEEGYTMTIKKYKFNEVPDIPETDTYKNMMHDFHSYTNGYEYTR